MQQINVGACIEIALQDAQEKLLMALPLWKSSLEHESQSAGNATKPMENEDG